MARIADGSVESVSALRVATEKTLRDSSSLQHASQRFAELLFDALSDSAVLFRVFATVAQGALPERDQDFVLDLARERRCREQIHEKTPVIALLGTRGRRPSWNDRYRSRRHLAIPLVQASFIKTIPMVSRLMSDMGTGLEWVEKLELSLVVKSTGQMARLLYVGDARTACTEDGFKVVPDREFVAANGVRTVVGLGGAYLNRTIVTVILFTDELAPQAAVEKLMPLIHAFKVATMRVVMQNKIFDTLPTEEGAP
jgi:hypothetical protein